MGAGGPRKPFLELEGRTLLEHACAAFALLEEVFEIVPVVRAEDRERAETLARTRPELAEVARIARGGAERVDSVRAGVTEVRAEARLVAIHDAARPLVTSEAVRRALLAAAEHGAALLALPVRDTLHRSPDGLHAPDLLDRAGLWAAQTPQAFEAARFRACLEEARRDGFRPSDDAALWQRYVGAPALVRGEIGNLKITEPEDLELARAVLAERAASRSPGGTP
jgi:2-C-methyl-D-erythritol 4-phosphate cytidylyltransferase